ncbi:hypothetical protein niasHT_028903 [Heterodera trifolii]|uniref:Reverse transcriptase domain-containing protein n=1 Tax=Heterodera trifolii TaxID=157864 RepID=A0ABD2KCT2_9BILA
MAHPSSEDRDNHNKISKQKQQFRICRTSESSNQMKKRAEFPNAEKWENEDFRQFIIRHKQLLNNFKFVDLKEEQFKGLMLLTALKSSRDTVLRQRILSNLASDGENVKYDEVVEDCINFMTTITEAKMIEHSTSKLTVNAVKQNVNKREKGNVPKFQQGHTSAHTPIGHLERQCDKVQEWLGKNARYGAKKKAKAHLSLKPDAQPVFRKARPVPYNAREAVEGELDRWEKMGVIEKIEYTNWAAPILVVKKADGSARLCIDYSTGLNAALQDHQHPLPLPDDIFAALNGGKFFSKIDLRDAYLQVELDEKSKKICAISTHRGNYQVKRLPFGIKSAPIPIDYGSKVS